MRRTWMIGVVLSMRAFAADSSAPAVPLNTLDDFMTFLAPRLQDALPGYRVTPDLGQGTVLIMDPDDAKEGHLAIKQEYQFCKTDPKTCDIAFWIKSVAPQILKRDRPPDPAELRPLIVSRAALEAELAPRGPRAPALIMRSFAGDFVITLMTDRVDFPRYLNERELKALNLTVDEAFDQARTQLRRDLIAATELAVPSRNHPVLFANYNRLESSRALLLDDWDAFAARCGGKLVITLPAANLIAYSLKNDSKAVEKLRQFAEAAIPSSVRPTSTLVFQRSPDGWEILK